MTDKINLEQAIEFLTGRYGTAACDISFLGAGAWSQTFGFKLDGRDLVVKFGKHRSDFLRDQEAVAYAGPDLPIPEILEFGEAFDRYFAIATRVFGVPLESIDAADWQATLPSLVAAFEAMRLAQLPEGIGVHSWGDDKERPPMAWSQFLLGVAKESEDPRGQGWRDKLANSSVGFETFNKGLARLKEVVSDEIQLTLIHRDMINRNVFVHENRISGLFDWGCAVYGDHLYELAWFEFWGSWYPELDMTMLRSALEETWREADYWPENMAERIEAAYLHIGLEHLAYNANIGNTRNLELTEARMKALIDLS